LTIIAAIAIEADATNRGISVIIKDRTGKSVALYKKSHALLIGVSDYSHGWPDLETIPNELSNVEYLTSFSEAP
jgi:hypothetical protein